MRWWNVWEHDKRPLVAGLELAIADLLVTVGEHILARWLWNQHLILWIKQSQRNPCTFCGADPCSRIITREARTLWSFYVRCKKYMSLLLFWLFLLLLLLFLLFLLFLLLLLLLLYKIISCHVQLRWRRANDLVLRWQYPFRVHDRYNALQNTWIKENTDNIQSSKCLRYDFNKEGRKSYPSNTLFKVFSKTGGRGDLFVRRNILVIF